MVVIYGSETPAVRKRLAPIRRRYPHWRIWRGVGGLFYARKYLTSPPRILRRPTLRELGTELRKEAPPATAPEPCPEWFTNLTGKA